MEDYAVIGPPNKIESFAMCRSIRSRLFCIVCIATVDEGYPELPSRLARAGPTAVRGAGG